MAAAECDATIVPSSLLVQCSGHQTDFAPGGPWDLGVKGFGVEPDADPEVGEDYHEVDNLLLAASQAYESGSTHETAAGAEGNTLRRFGAPVTSATIEESRKLGVPL